MVSITSVLSWVGSRQQSSTENRDAQSVELKVGDLTDSGNDAGEFVDWVKRKLNIGDEVKIRIVDAVEADRSIERSSRERELYCSFCGKMSSEVSKIIAAQQVNICNECVEVSNQVLSNNQESSFGSSVA